MSNNAPRKDFFYDKTTITMFSIGCWLMTGTKTWLVWSVVVVAGYAFAHVHFAIGSSLGRITCFCPLFGRVLSSPMVPDPSARDPGGPNVCAVASL